MTPPTLAAIMGKSSGSWWEAAIKPGLEGELGTGTAGSFYGRVSGAGGYTWNGTDAAGSNAQFGAVTKWRWEDAYLGWCSNGPSGNPAIRQSGSELFGAIGWPQKLSIASSTQRCRHGMA